MSIARGIGTENAQQLAIRRRRTSSVREGVSAVQDAGGAYAGLVTRTIAFALDAAVINGVALIVFVVVALGVSVLHLPDTVNALIAGVGGLLWVLWSIGYFVVFWSSTGQTPGDRAMGITVILPGVDGAMTPPRAMLRLVFLWVAAIPLLAGILMMLWDDRRRALHDRVASTLVVYAPGDEYAAGRRG